MKQKPIVLSVGEILWDMLPAGKRAGGAPTNFVYHATMNGGDGYAISAVGNDQLGDELAGEVHSHHISAILQHNSYPTGTTHAKLDKEGVPQWSITQNVAWDHIRLNHDLSDMVSGADAVCFGTLALRNPESRETILSLLHDCKPSAIRYFDINIREQYYSKELIQELLELSSVFKINDDELEILRPMFNLPEGDEEACKWFINTYSLDYVILTAGAKYSIVASKTELSKFYTPKVPVVDTVGAGDAFSGVFTMGILEGRSLREAHRAAVNTAAYVCTQNGAWPDYPEEIPDYAASVPENELPQE
ncbi:carbohydrate kinase family protein [Aeriscardovia aeriphila]|uniref:2-dehydro-3-deoxygluconokinase n=1 Tax=Aeriscardovia aeriphila TaxID=218139 RepID=A0A261FAL6_9BIFI|nr:carbohydrate kinase [Aeriscardovia aeriphila]NYI25652.1 fructokinase [Aeriscardovia aeriphila]OZG56200.1 2-dehydro-3-deoxygluconokinase [Aeriscardovia aeriphila]